MKLYEFGPARSVRVRWALQEMDIPFEAVQVNLRAGEHRLPEFLKLNPAGKIPVMEDDGFILTESAAMVQYLAEKNPEHRLMPSDLQGRAQHQRWVLFCMTELEPPLWRITKHTFLYPEEKRIPADVELAKADFKAMAAVLEEHMAGKAFVMGEHLTAVDFVMAYTLDWSTMWHLLEGCPNLQGYVERMYSRPKAPPRMAVAFAAG